ncbi:unnamed protein product [marine sediment metagenome]|uniref:HEPN domain-containing protein n=1 Tax=marine sediment metagenome TaxID=412755 RepID=X0W3V5_9ZZZZ
MVTDWRLWITQAEHDLNDAKSNLSVCCYSVCVFLCQQAIEKGLKALLMVQKGEEPPRIHSLRTLCHVTGFEPNDTKTLIMIDRAYTATRYPDTMEWNGESVLEEKDAREALRVTTDILQAITTRIEEHNAT